MRKQCFSLFWLLVLMCQAVLVSADEKVSLVTLPASTNLIEQIGVPPKSIDVYEPHLTQLGEYTKLTYRGYPACDVFDALMGKAWRDSSADMEFKALDGYVSRIPIEQFSRYAAYVVFAEGGDETFTVNNAGTGEKNIQLAPYYLIWDNINSPDLLKQGATDWPYQVYAIGLSYERVKALLPNGMEAKWSATAALVQKHCLTCHRVDNYGGDKFPIDLLDYIGEMNKERFIQWITEPTTIKPETKMPALLRNSPLLESRGKAADIYDYLLRLREVKGQE